MEKKARESMERHIEAMKGQKQLLESEMVDGFELFNGLINFAIKNFERVVQDAEEGKPLVGGLSFYATEILEAMDLVPLTLQPAGFMSMFMGVEEWVSELEEAERMGIPTDICASLRSYPYLASSGAIPVPSAIFTFTHSCDTLPTVFNILSVDKVWGKIPTLSLDGPWIIDEEGLDYYTGEVKQLVSFLEEHTKRKLDLDRLREVVEEANKQKELWQEYYYLRAEAPCPHSSLFLFAPWGMAHYLGTGNPEATSWFRQLVKDAEERIKTNRPMVEKQKIRTIWGDIQGVLNAPLYQRLEQELGTMVTMDMFADCPYRPIDTSNEESIFRGLGERMLTNLPMIGQMMGPVDRWMDRVVQVVRDHKPDCVLMPLHRGHKEMTAVTSIIKDTLRKNDIPNVMFDCDVYDPRVMSVDALMERIDGFFNTMGLG